MARAAVGVVGVEFVDLESFFHRHLVVKLAADWGADLDVDAVVVVAEAEAVAVTVADTVLESVTEAAKKMAADDRNDGAVRSADGCSPPYSEHLLSDRLPC